MYASPPSLRSSLHPRWKDTYMVRIRVCMYRIRVYVYRCPQPQVYGPLTPRWKEVEVFRDEKEGGTNRVGQCCFLLLTVRPINEDCPPAIPRLNCYAPHSPLATFAPDIHRKAIAVTQQTVIRAAALVLSLAIAAHAVTTNNVVLNRCEDHQVVDRGKSA